MIPLSIVYVPLTAFTSVSVVFAVSVVNVDLSASDVVTTGSVETTLLYTYVTVIELDVYLPAALLGVVLSV